MIEEPIAKLDYIIETDDGIEFVFKFASNEKLEKALRLDEALSRLWGWGDDEW